jgi:hypothetical protein
MNDLKHKLLIVLILSCVCIQSLNAEPNQPGGDLKFESSQQEKEWVIGNGREKGKVVGEWSIKPTHVGELFIWNIHRERWSNRGRVQYRPVIDFTNSGTLKDILGTSSGIDMSQSQLEFLRTGQAINVVGSYGEIVGNYFCFRCYAVSEDDAKKTVKALMEFLTYKAHELYDYQLKRQKSLQAVRDKLDAISKVVHYLYSKEAGEIVLELNKTLNSLDVEIAGLQAKVSAIEAYRPMKTNVLGEINNKLEAMMAEQSVQLAGALAKKEALMKIRDQAEEFYNLYEQKKELPMSINALKSNLSEAENSLERVKATLFKLPPEMQPPKVFQNKVTIYPVHIDEIILDVNDVSG